MPFKLLPEQKPEPTSFSSIAKSAARVPLTAATGVAASIPGVFGDIASSFNAIADPLAKAMGQETVPYEETLLGKALPTTETHLKNIQEKFPQLKPRNKVEEFSQNFTKDAASLFAPGQIFKMGKYALGPLRSLGISLAANTAGDVSGSFMGDKDKGDMLKRGTMLGLSLFNPTSAKDITRNLYEASRKALPQGASVNASGLLQSLTALENKILSSRPPGADLAPSEKFVMDGINSFRKLIQNGRVGIEALVAQKRSFNEEMQNNVYKLADRASRARARELGIDLNHSATDTLKGYGKANPEWWRLQSSADKAHGAIAQSNFISRILEKFMKGKPEALAHIFGIGLPAGATFISPIGSIAGTAGYQAAKIMTRIVKSPVLAKHYAKVVGAAAADASSIVKKDNDKIIRREIDSFEAGLEKDSKKTKSRFRVLP